MLYDWHGHPLLAIRPWTLFSLGIATGGRNSTSDQFIQSTTVTGITMFIIIIIIIIIIVTSKAKSL